MSAPEILKFPHPAAVYKARAAELRPRIEELRAQFHENPTAQKYQELTSARARKDHWFGIGVYADLAATRPDYADYFQIAPGQIKEKGRRASQAGRARSQPVPPELEAMLNVLEDPRTAQIARSSGLSYFLDEMLDGARKTAVEHEALSAPDTTQDGSSGTPMDYDRSFGSYQALTGFGKGFGEDIEALGPDDIFLDSGAGQAVAVGGALERFGGKGVAIDLLRGDNIDALEAKYAGRFSFLKGNAKDLELPRNVSIISDYFGALSYEPKLTATLQAFIDSLQTGGRLYTRLYDEANLVDSGGTPVLLKDWIARIPGLSVEKSGLGIRITKTADSVSVPELGLAGYGENAPPPRYFYELAQGQPAAGTQR